MTAGMVLFVLVVLIPGVAWLMMIHMPGKSYQGALPPLTADEAALRERLRAHLQELTVTIGERNMDRPDALKQSVEYISAQLASHGYVVEPQKYAVNGQECSNLIVERAAKGALQDEIVIVGAHYDSVHDCPGANDNGTGVVALLELARAYASASPQRTLRFVAFVNEEPPYFQTRNMGSWVYAAERRRQKENVVAMISLETMGCFLDALGTQKYPAPLGMLYPSTGNFIGFVGNVKSRSLVRQCVKAFRGQVKFPSEGAALPSSLPGIGWSDHWSFWQENYSAIMVTDTAPFRYRFYHTSEDTIDKIDIDRFARVVAGMKPVIDALANGD